MLETKCTKYYVWNLKCDMRIGHHFVLLFFYVAFTLWTVQSQLQVNDYEYASLVEWELTGENQSTRRGTCRSACLPITRQTFKIPKTEPGLCSEKLVVADSLSCDMTIGL